MRVFRFIRHDLRLIVAAVIGTATDCGGDGVGITAHGKNKRETQQKTQRFNDIMHCMSYRNAYKRETQQKTHMSRH